MNPIRASAINYQKSYLTPPPKKMPYKNWTVYFQYIQIILLCRLP